MAEKLAHDLEWIADRSVRPLPAHGRRDGLARDRAVRCGGGSCRRASLDSRPCAGSAESPRCGGPVDRGPLEAMSATLVHRGPDSDGTLVDGPVGLAARRLSIIDLERRRPADRERGRLDPRRPERRDLQPRSSCARELEREGHRFRTHCDTEVHRAPLRGARAALRRRLRGMFAVAIWDAPRRRLVLARDRFGIKPLYYRRGGGELAFASELRALPRGEIDLDALEAFLAFNSIPAPLTIFREIRKLPPGHVLVWERRRAASSSATRGPRPFRRTRCGREDEAELVEELRARLRDSVRAHLVSDVPVGVLLSGGVDSVAARGARRAGARRAAADVLDRLRGALLRRARRRAPGRRALRRPTTTSSSLRPDAALLLPALAEAFDEPFADSSALPDLPRLASSRPRDVKVALSGEGGDELFGGYYTYVADLLAPTHRAGSRGSRGRSSSGCRASTREGELRLQGEALRPRRRTCRRSSATTPGRRSSRRTRAPS